MSVDAYVGPAGRGRFFNSVEMVVLRLMAGLFVLNAGLMLFRGGAIDGAAYGVLFLLALLLGSIGQYYRYSGRGEAIGDALTCAALMILFSNSIIVFNYLLLPIERPVIDPMLMVADSWLGYSWPAAVQFGADHPWFNLTVKYAYMTTMPQITVLVVLLGLTGRRVWLHRLLVSISVTSVFLICFWALFPSHGPSAFYTLSQDLIRAVQPIVGPHYGETLKTMMAEGPKVVRPSDVEGLIAFPSYHTTLAFICAWCAFGFRPLFPAFLVLNALILPGTLIHGGHHLVDLPAGFLLFLIGALIANRVVADLPQEMSAKA
ncbi:MAG: phosphatase PAP2 family protein [Pseudomonadota bacterium]